MEDMNGLHSVVQCLTTLKFAPPTDWDIVSDRQARKDNRAIAHLCKRDGYVTSVSIGRHMNVSVHFARRKLKAAEARGILERASGPANQIVRFTIKEQS